MILEDDLEVESKSVDSCDEDFEVVLDIQLSASNDKISKKSSSKLVPYSQNKRLNQMARVVNFIRKKSSNNSL